MATEESISIAKLWQNYLFLTTEMKKILDKKDFALFNELLRQREVLQQTIEKTPDDDFRSTDDGKACLQAIDQQNQLIRSNLEYLRNIAKRNNEVATAYDNFASTPVGHRMNWQR